MLEAGAAQRRARAVVHVFWKCAPSGWRHGAHGPHCGFETHQWALGSLLLPICCCLPFILSVVLLAARGKSSEGCAPRGGHSTGQRWWGGRPWGRDTPMAT